MTDKAKEIIPENTKQATDRFGQAVDGIVTDVQDKFGENTNENSAGQTRSTSGNGTPSSNEESSSSGGILDILKRAVGSTRHHIDDTTNRSHEDKKAEKPLVEQMQQEFEDAKNKIDKDFEKTVARNVGPVEENE